jgi:hypothetical protein
LTASQVESNYLFGPWLATGTAKAISFAAIRNATVRAGAMLVVTNFAVDPDQPPLALTFSILSGPSGATINPGNGVFTWVPAIAQANTTNTVTLLVTNNASASLSATRSFVVTVTQPVGPSVSDATIESGHVQFEINGIPGSTFGVQTATNLRAPVWQTIFRTNASSLPFSWSDTNSDEDTTRFYRVVTSP